MGVIATMPISAGTKILEEPPLATGRTVDFRQPSHVRDHVAHLSDEERPTLGSLYNAFSEEYDSGLFRTNSYGLGCNSSWEGTFDTLSRVNHSCRPNSESCWDSNRQVGTLYSLWNIQVGEELTVSYIDVAEMTHDERQSELKQRWRFDCICACCSITEVVAQNTNDQRRRFIGRLHQEMSSFPASAMYRLATMAYKYADEEGLRGSPAASISLYGYRMALRLCNVEDVKKWIARYHSEHLLGTGPSSCWTKEAFALMKKRTHRVEWNPLCSEVALYSCI